MFIGDCEKFICKKYWNKLENKLNEKRSDFDETMSENERSQCETRVYIRFIKQRNNARNGLLMRFHGWLLWSGNNRYSKGTTSQWQLLTSKTHCADSFPQKQSEKISILMTTLVDVKDKHIKQYIGILFMDVLRI
jgi:hypothetical protein